MLLRTEHCLATALMLGLASPAFASFELLPLGTTGTTATSVTGSSIQFFDTLYLAPGASQGPTNSINQYALPSNFSIISQQSTTVVLDGSAIGQPGGTNYNVGNLLDYVLLDSATSRLVFTTRLTLFETVAGVQNVYEVNNMLRRGFTGITAEAAWVRASDDDLRLYNAARTTTLFGQGTRTYDPDTILMQTDVNVSEGNPWSGYFLLRTNAQYYRNEAGMVSLYQAGEEGQPVNLQTYAAYRPSAAIFLDSDNDGISNANELLAGTNPNDSDSDDDGIPDGVELGATAGVADDDGVYGANQGTSLASFVADADGATTTNPLSTDTDGDGIADGVEDANLNGAFNTGETNPNAADTDGDGIPDGVEDANKNGIVDAGETDPRNPLDPAPVTTPTQVPVPTFALLALGAVFAQSARRRLIG